MIKVENLTFLYHRTKKAVLDDFSLNLEQGMVYGLLGKNGAGKSTLLYLMSGLLTPKKGRVLFKGVNVRERRPSTMSDIFLVSEEFELPSIDLKDFVKVNAPFYPRFSQEDMVKYLGLFGLEEDVNLGKLSMGQKKKVYMSFALATNTSLLLMDEPTNGLDIPGKSQFRKFIATGMADNKTIVISTHQVRDVDTVLDHVLIMDNTKVLVDARVMDITSKLSFINTNNRELVESAIYAQSSIAGSSVILKNTGEEETEINLELLFNAVLEKPKEITEVLTAKKEE